MAKLTDLELEKRIAEIEGITVSESIMMVKGNPIPTGRGLITDEYIEFNPLADRAMLWDLRLKHKVEIDDECTTCRIWDYEGNLDSGCNWVVDYETDKHLPRAMLEVIVEANNEN